jgi:intein-encoded DNA endonuclease-like protein
MSKRKTYIKSSIELNSKIIDLYQSGLTTKEVAMRSDCCISFVSKILKENDVPIRGYKKYQYNEDFFKIIDTEEKAYVLGLLYADGNNYVSKNGYQIRLALQESDRKTVEKVRDLLAPMKTLTLKKIIRNGVENLYYLLSIDSKIISQQLSTLGCVPKKSMILEYPSWLTDVEFQRHFIRGYFDGDGSICYDDKKIR